MQQRCQEGAAVLGQVAEGRVCRKGAHAHLLEVAAHEELAVLEGVDRLLHRRRHHEAAGAHLPQRDAQREPVHREGVARLLRLGGEMQLGRHVRLGACAVVELLAGLELEREAKVGDAQAALLVDENVWRLDVSVDDADAVHVGEARDELARHEAQHVLGRRVGAEALLEVVEVAAEHEVDHHEDRLGRLEAVVEVDEEGVVERGHHLRLDSHVHGPAARHLRLRLLGHDLHRVALVRVLLAHGEHLAEGADAQPAEVVKVVDRGHLLLALLELDDAVEVR
mmetsp:Transcript_24121/g.52635  ORF Transcript_24121/g.52635 Transcript_24121/m.52635 type:complete len:281 (+) Transcript_24121:1312-2154(+)